MNTTSTKPLLLSKKGFRELKKAIAELEHDQKMTIQALRDLDKTNAHEERLERVEKLAQLESIESELADKRLALSEAKLLPSKRARLKVAIGSVVDLIDQQGRLFRYTIVDSMEADPSDGRISAVSPLGSNLIGKAAKDVVEFGNGLRTQRLKLVRIM